MDPKDAQADGEELIPTEAAIAAPSRGLSAAEGGASLGEVGRLAADCRACGLWERATQTVFGQGPTPAALMLVGEQPGDQEDRMGDPFVGPAGRLLDEALRAAGIDRRRVFVTNVVKHFKWRAGSGKRRLHEKPNRAEVRACHPWIAAELVLVRPRALVCLGATAAAALLGPSVRVSASAGKPIPSPLAPMVLATLHPSAVLRSRDAAAREDAFDRLVGDLRLVVDRIPEVHLADDA